MPMDIQKIDTTEWDLTTPTKVEKTYTPEQRELIDQFFSSIERYYTQDVQRWVASSTKMLEIALTKPRNARTDLNICRDTNGTTYKMGNLDVHTFGYWEMRRSGPGLAPYKRTGVFIPEDRTEKQKGSNRLASINGIPVEQAMDHPEADWAWYIEEGENPHTDFDYALSSLRGDLLAHHFVGILKKQRHDIAQWLIEYAAKSNRPDAASWKQDVSDFYSRFAIALAPGGKDLPDPSGIHAQLHHTLDRLAGYSGREYLH